MKVFTDPVSKIPPLLESDIKTKIIISKLKKKQLKENKNIKKNNKILHMI